MGADGETLTRKLCDAALGRYEPGKGRWHYEDGLMHKAFEAAYRRWGAAAFLDVVRRWGEAAVPPGGAILSYRRDEYNLDQVNAGKALFFYWTRPGTLATA